MDVARFSDREARGVTDVLTGAQALAALDTTGFWVVVATFEGEVTAVRFAEVRSGAQTRAGGVPRAAVGWLPLAGAWTSSLDRTAYLAAVREVRRRIASGTVYQANICRVLRHPLDETADLEGLEIVLRQGNPAPHAALVRVGAAHLDVVCASPELFLRRDGSRLVSEPVKGTATAAEAMLRKDYAENVMIVDLVRNDLSHVCVPGSVDVEALCAVVAHPGLVHLVSTVAGRLRPGRDLETSPRGPYCGAIGWVDADRRQAELAVGIRTFWADHDDAGRRWLSFGTGAGITWGSDPAAEWAETELKAERLVGLASGRRHATAV